MENAQKALITIVSSIKFLATLRGKQENKVARNLNQHIKKNNYSALIVDDTTDNSTKEQVSVSLRHVNDDFDVFEDFTGLYETSSTTGDTLEAIIEDVLLKLVLPIEECRDLEPVSLSRVRKPPQRVEHNITASPPVHYSSPEQFLRQKYFAVIDSIKGKIESRFQHPGVGVCKAIENVLVKSSNGEVENIRDQVLQVCEHFKGDLNVERFTRQLTMLTELTV
ncbi:hypothetical protein PR048_031483, partial [Dryococelus australis]